MILRYLVICLMITIAFSDSPAAESEDSSIGYESVATALNELKQDPESKVTTQDGWTIIQSSGSGSMALWSFAPQYHPAYPAAVKRVVIEEKGGVYIHMTALCEATKIECDKLIEQFKALNDQLRQRMGAPSDPAPAQGGVDQTSFISGPNDQSVVEDRIRKLSESYLTDIFDGSNKAAFAYLSTEMQSYQSFEEWSARIDKQRLDAGSITAINVHTITVYHNPPNAPRPGLYVAADYQNSSQNAPYHCGFLVWFRGESGDFEITREETGLITHEDFEMIPDDSKENVLAQMKCNAP